MNANTQLEQEIEIKCMVKCMISTIRSLLKKKSDFTLKKNSSQYC